MTTRSDTSRRILSTPVVLTAAAIAAVGFVLTFGTSSLDVAKLAVPHQLALKTAQLGLVAPAAQAAPIASEAGYLPAQLVVQGHAEEPLPPQF